MTKTSDKQLEYLFVCHFNDNSCIRQTQDNVSSIDPSKSAYFDVAQRITEVSKFQLYNGKMSYTVKMQSGEFIVNGTRLFLDDDSADITQRELIYFRRVRRTVSPMGETATTNYHLGWRTVDYTFPRERTIIIPAGSTARL